MEMANEPSVRDQLRAFGVSKPRWQAPLFLGLVPALCAFLAGISVYYWNREPQVLRWNDVTQAVSGLAIFLVLFWQWRRARQEASFEKFYERLDMANKRMVAVMEQVAAGHDPKSRENPVGLSIYDMWVFTEVDNLEYAIEKYRLGYMSGKHFDRALATFESRCRTKPAFSQEVCNLVGACGYQRRTERAVQAILAKCESDVEHTLPRKPLLRAALVDNGATLPQAPPRAAHDHHLEHQLGSPAH